MKPRQLAIIRAADYGMRDTYKPCLWFDVHFDGGVSLQLFYQPQADKVLKDFEVYRIADLNGQTCFVEVDGGVVTFSGKASI